MTELDTELEEYYWKKKVESVALVSKKYGYPEYNEEFWMSQVAGVISLIMSIWQDRRKNK
jgi:hypothetical protein